MIFFLFSRGSEQRAEHFSDEGIPQRYLKSLRAGAASGSVDGMVINALFTYASCCLLLWLGSIQRDIAKEALFAHCDMRKRSYFVVNDFPGFFFKFCKFCGLLGHDRVLY